MTADWSPLHYYRTQGKAPLVLICEHASKEFPQDFGDMGLTHEAANAHVAWDIGALEVAKGLSDRLDAPLAYAGVSRLLYDCNRPLHAPDCIPAKSERYDIPGNQDLSETQRQRRFQLIHQPFHAGVTTLIDTQTQAGSKAICVVTIHSFTPVYQGQVRDVELGYLAHDHQALSQKALEYEHQQGRYKAALNQPYDKSHGVTYSLARHGDSMGHPATLIEIRNDLIDTHETAQTMADHLAATLRYATAELGFALPPLQIRGQGDKP